MKIYNCHTHLFTIDHVPRKFINPIVAWVVRKKGVRKLARKVWPFGNRDLVERYINFAEVTLLGSQKKILDFLKGYYPYGGTDETKFIVLPMDMKYMLAGKIKTDLNEQHAELERLLRDDEPILPFIAVDPRRKDVLPMVMDLHLKGFKGIKLYPPLGYYPNDSRLDHIFKYAEEENFPIMSHCSRGGIHIKKVTEDMLEEPNPLDRPVKKCKAKTFSNIYTDPANYDPIARKYPKLKICLAHFGGDIEWDKYLETSWHPGMPEEDKSWLSVIIDLILEHDNIYTDISSTLFSEEKYMNVLLVLLENEKIRSRVLFGSDFYMMERVKSKEREMAIYIRSKLGAELFEQIAFKNPQEYLGINNQ